MKNLLFSFFIYFFLFNVVFATNSFPINNITKNVLLSKNKKEIKEFFSFLCPYCYNFESRYQFTSFLKKNFFKTCKINSYHVSMNNSNLEKILSKAWIIAKETHVENKVLIPIYKNIQEKKYINNFYTLKNIFIKNSKISSQVYDMYWNSLSVEIRLKKESDIINKFHIMKIPSIYINKKYLFESNNIYNLSKKKFLDKQLKLINFLLNKY